VSALPGISKYNLGKIADKTKYADADGEPDAPVLFGVCESRAIQTFFSAFTAAINTHYRLCDLDVISCLVCENKNKLGIALMYYIGHEIMVERVASDRLNRFTTVDLDKAKELRADFLERAEYELNTAVKGINPNAGECAADVAPVEPVADIRVIQPLI
jgi:hypothetical protein